MAYFRCSIKVGHWGVGANRLNKFYVQANNILLAMKKIQQFPTVHHNDIPKAIEKCSEDEYIINACVNFYDVHYNFKITPLSIKDIKKHVFIALSKEKKINNNHEFGNMANILFVLVNECDNAISTSDKMMYQNVLNNWITYNYEHQDEILSNRSNVEEYVSKNA